MSKSEDTDATPAQERHREAAVPQATSVAVLRSLKAKLLISALGLIAVLCVTWVAVTSHFAATTREATALESTAADIRRQVLEVRSRAQDFLLHELQSAEFHAGDTTATMEEHRAELQYLRSLVAQFVRITSEAGEVESGEELDAARRLPRLVDKYEKDFAELLDAYRKTGHGDTGVVGEMSDAADGLDALFTVSGEPTLQSLWLRTQVAEKRYVATGTGVDAAAGEMVTERIGDLRKAIAETEGWDGTAALELLATYEEAYGRYLALDRRIGRTAGEGLRGAMSNTVRAIDPAAKAAVDGASETRLRAEATQTRASIGITLLGFLLTAAAFYMLSVSITRPIVEVKDAALAVAAGRLDVRLSIRSRDEVGVLRDAFNRMLAALRAATSQMREGSSVVNGTASQLASSTSEVTAASSETSAAMTQAVATIEAVKESARTSTSRARHVSEVSSDASGVAEAGRTAARDSIDGIQRIREEMDDIAATIMALNEQGQAIAEIISTVNDLAERSNLLAVNAAIEAAKAGDEGRGFVVVANEIKGLADQSKKSTAEVRLILNKIQKGTAAAVMAAERGRKAVEHGIRQSAQAGEAIGTLGNTIDEVAHAAAEISASMQQVDAGVNQVFTAMASVLAATQQNESAIGEVDAAIKHLQETAADLHRKADVYQL